MTTTPIFDRLKADADSKLDAWLLEQRETEFDFKCQVIIVSGAGELVECGQPASWLECCAKCPLGRYSCDRCKNLEYEFPPGPHVWRCPKCGFTTTNIDDGIVFVPLRGQGI